MTQQRHVSGPPRPTDTRTVDTHTVGELDETNRLVRLVLGKNEKIFSCFGTNNKERNDTLHHRWDAFNLNRSNFGHAVRCFNLFLIGFTQRFPGVDPYHFERHMNINCSMILSDF